MARGERWLIDIWVVAAIWTLLSFAIYQLPNMIVVVLMLIGIGVPLAMLLSALPTVFLYMTAAAPIYLLLRRRSRVLAGVVAAIGVAAVATVLPLRANDRLEREVRDFARNDRGEPMLLPSGNVVAYLSSYGASFDWNRYGCEDVCQRLLLSGAAREVLLGDVAALDGKAAMTRYWIAPAKGPCPKARLSPVYADERDVGKDAPFPRPFLSSKLGEIFGDGNCLYEGRVTIDAADVVLVSSYDYGRAASVAEHRFDPRLGYFLRRDYVAIQVRTQNGSKLSCAGRRLSRFGPVFPCGCGHRSASIPIPRAGGTRARRS